MEEKGKRGLHSPRRQRRSLCTSQSGRAAKISSGFFTLPSTMVLLASVLLAAAPPAVAWEREPLSVYHQRRARLVGDTGDGVIVLFGYAEADVAASVTGFHQNEAFYYLTGWHQPDAMLLVVPKSATGSRRDQPAEIDKEILFIPPNDYRAERWN